MTSMSSYFGASFDAEASITLKPVNSSAITSSTVETAQSLKSLNSAYWDGVDASFQGASILVIITAIDAADVDELYELLFEVDSSADFSGSTGARNFQAGYQEDADGGPSYVDLTTELGDATPNDVGLFPAGAAVDDAFYFGLEKPFNIINMNVGTAGTGTYTVAWEYYNGSSWTSLSVTDGTDSFKNSGANTVTFSAPVDWAKTTVNSGEYFFVRAKRDGGTVTADPLATSAQADDVQGVVIAGAVIDRSTAVGRYVLPVDGDTIHQMQPQATHIRAKAKLSGTTPSLTYNAYLMPPVGQ